MKNTPFQYRGKWTIRYTDEFGRRRKQSFEKHAAAEHALIVERARIKEVKVGVRSPTPPNKTFDQLADYWIENRVPQKRSGNHDESIIRAHLRPAFGPLLLKKIGLAEGDRFQNERLHLDSKTVHNQLTLLISMLNVAVDLGWLIRIPKIKKPEIFTKAFRYLSTEEEFFRFLRGAFADGELVGMLYATALYTGMREGEVAGLRWDRIDLAKRLITVEFSYDGPTKGGVVRHVPILDPLLVLLEEWRPKCPGALVFPNQRGNMHRESARVFQEVFHRVLDSAGFPKNTVNGRPRRHIVFHDLRHTFASHWMMNGGCIFKLQRILGHKQIQMTQRYAHLAPEAFVGDHGRLGTLAPARFGSLPEGGPPLDTEGPATFRGRLS